MIAGDAHHARRTRWAITTAENARRTEERRVAAVEPLLNELSAILDREPEDDYRGLLQSEAVEAFARVRHYLLPELWCEDGLPTDCERCDARPGNATCNHVAEFDPHVWCDGADPRPRWAS